jgi:hypothetical protein
MLDQMIELEEVEMMEFSDDYLELNRVELYTNDCGGF